MTDQLNEPGGFERRAFLKRSALVGGAAVWATPVIQSVVSSAAAGTPFDCFGCIQGGGQILDAGLPDAFVTFLGETASATIAINGTAKLCCDDTEQQVNLVFHTGRGSSASRVEHIVSGSLTITCAVNGNDPGGGGPGICANVFTGTITTSDGTTLQFSFEDNGEGANADDVDKVSFTLTGPDGVVIAQAMGSLDRGNLNVVPDTPPLTRECNCPTV
ncbi:MAG: twin-arginine translocation signal domain-containing protein [Actinomycetota bacterium]|nr:twin-arginine translocation signal domain-containing protein [Actinomycetota bacterium]